MDKYKTIIKDDNRHRLNNFSLQKNFLSNTSIRKYEGQ